MRFRPRLRHQHAGAKTDAGGDVGRPTELYPHIGIERWRVVEPRALVAELLGNTGMLV